MEPAEDVEAEKLEEDDVVEGEEPEEVEGNVKTDEINISSFTELCLDEAMVKAAQDSWALFISSCASREAAGEAIYTALFEGAPSLQSLFTTPRAVQAMRFMNGLASFVTALSEPTRLKVLVESLGFGHLHLDVTIPRVVIFRDILIDLLAMELGARFNGKSRQGWLLLLNYVGGAIIFCKANYKDRIDILGKSWKEANKEKDEGEEEHETPPEEKDVKTKKAGLFGKDVKDVEETKTIEENSQLKSIPQNFPDMFSFNAAVMGMGDRVWMQEVLACFHNLVVNVSSSVRFQEECDVMSLRIAKLRMTDVTLGEFKSCMLASLRSLLPGTWTTSHETAWSWFWDNVERLVKDSPFFSRGSQMERAYARLLDGLEEKQKYELRADIYVRFFASTPGGQNYFKQSNTYMHMIADKVLDMSLDIYKDPVKMVDDISALGLRHVGYAIPTEFFPPFVTACIEVLISMQVDDTAVDGFRNSVGLIAKMLVRTITEGSTIVMKAINLNSRKQMMKSISIAPRGDRAKWMLLVQVGTQSISPLAWALESGSLESAEAMIVDLLTMRADRDKYYYALDALYARHHDIIKMLLDEAPAILPTFLDGLIWRSRTNEGGLRRVNYYIKHLVVGPDGHYAMTLPWITAIKDPKLVCHPIVVFLNEIIWKKVVYRNFLMGKIWLFFTLSIFVVSQAVTSLQEDYPSLVFATRTFVYICSMGLAIYRHSRSIIIDVSGGKTMRFLFLNIPAYLKTWQESVSLALTCSLFAMFCLEPILACWSATVSTDHPFTTDCDAGRSVHFLYSFVSMVAMFLYYILLMDMSVFSNRLSSYVLTCTQLFSELGLFIVALGLTILTVASAVSCLDHHVEYFFGIVSGSMSLLEMAMRMFDARRYEELHKEPVVLAAVFMYLVVSTFFLINLLIAQLTCAYGAIFEDMVGYARLGRLQVICDALPSVGKKRWRRFVDSMYFDDKIEFGEGDIGLAGGVQIREPASVNPTTADRIKRFGGSTSPEIPWPANESSQLDDEDRFERVEKLMQALQKRVTSTSGSGGPGGKRKDAEKGFNSQLLTSGGLTTSSGGASNGEDAGSEED